MTFALVLALALLALAAWAARPAPEPRFWHADAGAPRSLSKDLR